MKKINWPKKWLIVLALANLTYPNVNAQYPIPAGYDSTTLLPPRGKIMLATIRKSATVPSLLITGGLLTINETRNLDKYDVWEERQEHIPLFRTHVDDYLQFAPIAAVYGLDLLKVKAKHNFTGQSIRLFTAELISQAIVLPLKEYTHVERPDGSDFRSFPSGHTTQAFVSATFMHKEFGHLSLWYSVGAYTTATAVGALRLMNNKHWISDVLVGAGVGILYTNAAYLIFQNVETKQRGKSKIFLMPAYYEGAVGLNMLWIIR